MRFLFLVLVCIYSLNANASSVMGFLGYDGQHWLVGIAQVDGTVKEITLAQEPHTFDYNFKTGQILYIGSDGKLRLYSNGAEKELALPYKANAYTQPKFSCNKDLAYTVELIDGNSKSTRIVAIDLQNNALANAVQQTSSQFEPSEINDHTLLFTNLSCNQGCGKLIQEIWQKNQASGISEQLTLLNAFSNNPSIHFNDHWVFFSSNKNDNYHIWGKNLNTDERSVELTFKDTTDAFPGAIGNGGFLYISQNKGQYHIMQGDIKGKSSAVKLSKQYKIMRQLKVNTCE